MVLNENYPIFNKFVITHDLIWFQLRQLTSWFILKIIWVGNMKIVFIVVSWSVVFNFFFWFIQECYFGIMPNSLNHVIVIIMIITSIILPTEYLTESDTMQLIHYETWEKCNLFFFLIYWNVVLPRFVVWQIHNHPWVIIIVKLWYLCWKKHF